jgi:subtilisin family serine protease
MVIPTCINLKAGPLPTAVTNSITMQNNSTNDLKLSEPVVSVPGVGAQIKETRPGKSFIAMLVFPQGFEIPQGLHAELSVKSSNPKFPLVKVPIMQLQRPVTPPLTRAATSTGGRAKNQIPSSTPSAPASPSEVVTNPPPSFPQIVTCQSGVDVDLLLQDYGIKATCIYRYAFAGFAAPVDVVTAELLKRDSRVVAFEPDGLAELTDTQITPTGVLRMGIPTFPVAHINSTSYWNSATGESLPIDVDVAVIDSGIDFHHPDLNVVAGVDFTGSGYGGQDCMGHGTDVAGVIGARNNTFGVVGVAPGVRLWAVQIICAGAGHNAWSNVLAGMDYIAQHADQISVANASIGQATVPRACTATQAAVAGMVSRGVVFVAAAGNGSGDIVGSDGVFGTNPATGTCDDSMPAALPEAMTVSAMDVHTDQMTSYSNYSYVPRATNYVTSPGGVIDVAAPGSDSGDPTGAGGILTCNISQFGDLYEPASGISVAAPHVAGLVALYIAANGRATNAEGVYKIRQAIVNSALPQSRWNNPNPNPMKNGVVPLPAPLAMPSENWVPKPWFRTAAMLTNTLQLTFDTVPGYTYTVEYAASAIASPPWTTLLSTNGNGRIATISVTDPAPDPSSRFYRVLRQPAP